MDVLRLIQGTVMPGIGVGRDAVVRLHQNSGKVSALGPRAAETGGGGDGNVMEIAASATVASVPVKQFYTFPLRLGRLWPGGGPAPKRESREAVVEERNVESPALATEQQTAVERQTDNWVLKILRVRSLWPEREEAAMEDEVAERDLRDAADAGDRCVGCGCADDSEGCVVGEDEEESKVFDQETFSRLLRRVSLVESQLYAKMSYLGCLAYDIPKMKPRNLHKYHGLRFVTSSFDKRRKSVHSKEDKKPAQDGKLKETKLTFEAENGEKWKEISTGISASTAYQVATTAASYLQSQTEGMLPSGVPENVKKSNRRENQGYRMPIPEEASFIATTSSVTAVVAGKEEMKQAVAEDLNSAKSSPCEWYICDDDNSATRYIVFQGSETLASWQANLLFEPVQFEGFDVLVHRGIYEAAKGIYKQMLPEIKAHLKDHGGSATLRFTGHSLGGSLAMLLNLMLLIRGDAPVSSLLPVITFGAPSVMCQGNYLLRKLGLPRSHVQAIAMHRDIVPRAFSCNYPDHVAKILKAVNGKFRNHPCLVNQKYLYAPMGNFLILQPDEKFSPHHHLLPPGSGLYILDNSWADSDDSMRLLRGAQSAFINSPHPLEILSDLTAYGSEGTVYRDHDMSSYLKSLRSVIRDELKLIRKAKRELRHDVWWPLVEAQSSNTSVATTTRHTGLTNSNQHQFNFASVINVGKQTFQRFGRLAASQHMHLLVVILFPARLLLLDALISY